MDQMWNRKLVAFQVSLQSREQNLGAGDELNAGSNVCLRPNRPLSRVNTGALKSPLVLPATWPRDKGQTCA